MKLKKTKLFLFGFGSLLLTGSILLSEPCKPLYAAKSINYISEIVLVTDAQKRSGDGYTYIDKPLYESKVTGGHSTYIGYKTTTKANDAITDIKLMNSKGGWSFSEYENFLDSLKDKAELMASQTWPAIEEFRENYENETDEATFAYDLLNFYYYDDYKVNDKPIKFGDLILDETIIEDSTSEHLKTIFLESNMSFLSLFYNALAMACSRNSDGETFIDVLEAIDAEELMDATYYNDIASTLMDNAASIRESILYYEDAGTKQYESFSNDEDREDYLANLYNADIQNGTSFGPMWVEGRDASELLTQVPYYTVEVPGVETLYDLVMADDAEIFEYYALVESMTPGLRSVALTGLIKMAENALTTSDHYYDNINKITEDDYYDDVVELGISIFYDVDREIYEDHAVAMTNASLRGSATGDKEWQKQIESAQRDNLSTKIHVISSYVMMGAGAYTTLGIILVPILVQKLFTTAGQSTGGLITLSSEIFAIGSSNGSTILANTFRQGLTNALVSTLPRTAQQVATTVFAWSAVLAVVALIVSLVLFFVFQEEDSILDYEGYVEIPGMICDYRYPIDPKTQLPKTKGDQKYVYYKGVKNPYGVRSEALFGDNENNKTLPANPKKIQDINNWEAGRGDRQWICLYTTKDRNVGYPIKATTLEIDYNQSLSKRQSACKFGEPGNVGFDVNSYYNFICKTNKENDLVTGSKYIHFQADPDAKYDDSKNSQATNILTGSAVNGTTLLTAIILSLGVGIGGTVLVQTILRRKKEGK